MTPSDETDLRTVGAHPRIGPPISATSTARSAGRICLRAVVPFTLPPWQQERR